MKDVFNDKKLIYLVFVIILMGILVLVFNYLTKKPATNNPQNNNGTIQPTTVQTQYQRPENLPVEVKVIPTLVPAEGKGLDLQSTPVTASKSEIAKLEGKLPYTETVTSGDISVGIVIPEQKYQDNNYTLLVNLNGIDFKLPSDDNNYFENRDAFVAAATRVLGWLKQNNVDVTKIIIKWGDRTFMNDKANVWLNYVKI